MYSINKAALWTVRAMSYYSFAPQHFIWFLPTLLSPFKLQPIKALLIKILEGVRIYLGALDDGILSPNFNPLNVP